MKRIIAAAFGATIVLFASAQTGPTVDSETAGFRVLEVSCAVESQDGGSLRCVAEIQRNRDDVGLLTAAWGLDGGFLATDAVTGSVTSWELDDPPSGDHVAHVVVVDPETGFAVEATTDVETGTGGSSWLLWLVLVGALATIGGVGLWVWRRRRVQQDGSIRCSTCSSVLAEGDRFCPACGAIATSGEDAFCPRCGNPADPSDGFCSHCGRVLVTDRPADSPQPER